MRACFYRNVAESLLLAVSQTRRHRRVHPMICCGRERSEFVPPTFRCVWFSSKIAKADRTWVGPLSASSVFGNQWLCTLDKTHKSGGKNTISTQTDLLSAPSHLLSNKRHHLPEKVTAHFISCQLGSFCRSASNPAANINPVSSFLLW